MSFKKEKMRWDKKDRKAELIAGTLPLDHPGLSICHEAIYQYIYDTHVRKQIDFSITFSKYFLIIISYFTTLLKTLESKFLSSHPSIRICLLKIIQGYQ